MSNATETMAGRGNVMPAELGSKFTRWGLGLFVLGFALGFIPILHYIHGAVAGDVGPAFLKNMTLWWGCPAVLMEYTLKTGGLGMVAIGLCYIVLPRAGSAIAVSGSERMAPGLCLAGLLGATVYMAVGYVVCNLIWPNFYFAPVETGKDVWLAGQLIGIMIYFYGIAAAYRGIRHHHLESNAVISATPAHAGR
ncbi:MAG TPA: hypothetical protein VMY42_20515 [Thermoguttaceae bacterium]|nr:hypothetical protein [Thermoguttaceae bacterium]